LNNAKAYLQELYNRVEHALNVEDLQRRAELPIDFKCRHEGLPSLSVE
jgi:hypothetical protein